MTTTSLNVCVRLGPLLYDPFDNGGLQISERKKNTKYKTTPDVVSNLE